MNKSDIIKEYEEEYSIEDNLTDKEKIMGLDHDKPLTIVTLA